MDARTRVVKGAEQIVAVREPKERADQGMLDQRIRGRGQACEQGRDGARSPAASQRLGSGQLYVGRLVVQQGR